jgi:tetratricopeptide (TPR) repeat protein
METSSELMAPEPLLATDMYLDIPSLEVAGERKIWVQEDEGHSHLPFPRQANVDILGSPKLTRLFENLKIETGDLPDDIELLVLPASVVGVDNPKSRKFISGSEMTLLCRDRDSSSNTWDKVIAVPDTEIQLITGPSRRPPPTSPFKFPGFDAWLPSGVQYDEVLPSPLNALPLFPPSLNRGSHKPQSSTTVVQSQQMQETAYSARLDKLKRAGFDEVHPVVLKATQGLAEVCYNQGKYCQAEKLYKKVLSDPQRSHDVFGSMDVLSLQLDLVDAIINQGRVSEAKEMHVEVHAAIVNALPPHHHLFRSSLNVMNRICIYAQNYHEGESICRELVQISLVYLGPRDPDTLSAIYRLATAMRDRNCYSESERLQRIVIQLYQKGQDQLHYDICCSLIELARVFEGQDQLEEAVKIYHVSSERAKQFLGDAHHTTMFSNYCLGRVLRRQGLLQESEELLMATVVLQVKTLGEDHPAPLVTIYDLGETLLARGKYQEAATWLKKSFQRSLAIFGPGYGLTMGSCNSLGLCYEKQGLYVVARALYQELIDKLRVAKGDNHPRISEIQGWIDEVNGKFDGLDEGDEGDEGNEGNKRRGRLLPGLVSVQISPSLRKIFPP